jgi:hypothetical protein
MDNLAPAIFCWLLICLLVLAGGIGALLWWRRRFGPSPEAQYSVWAGFIWSYLNFFGLAIVPRPLIATIIFTAAWRGVLLAVVVWIIVRLIRARGSGSL